MIILSHRAHHTITINKEHTTRYWETEKYWGPINIMFSRFGWDTILTRQKSGWVPHADTALQHPQFRTHDSKKNLKKKKTDADSGWTNLDHIESFGFRITWEEENRPSAAHSEPDTKSTRHDDVVLANDDVVLVVLTWVMNGMEW